MSPSPEAMPLPVARNATTSSARCTQERPSTFTLTSGTATPMSKSSVTPAVPVMTSVCDDMHQAGVARSRHGIGRALDGTQLHAGQR